MSPHVDREDLQQEYEVERAIAAKEGRSPRPRRWIEADYFRRTLGRSGQRANVYNAIDFEGMDRIAATPEPSTVEFRQSTLVERAIRIARTLPEEQGQPILAALRLVGCGSVDARLCEWLRMNPGRRAEHWRIAKECGVSRESVTRGIKAARKKLGIAEPVSVSRRVRDWFAENPGVEPPIREMAEKFGTNPNTIYHRIWECRAAAKRAKGTPAHA